MFLVNCYIHLFLFRTKLEYVVYVSDNNVIYKLHTMSLRTTKNCLLVLERSQIELSQHLRWSCCTERRIRVNVSQCCRGGSERPQHHQQQPFSATVRGGSSGPPPASAAAAGGLGTTNLQSGGGGMHPVLDKSTLKVHLPNGTFNVVRFGDAADIKGIIQLLTSRLSGGECRQYQHLYAMRMVNTATGDVHWLHQDTTMYQVGHMRAVIHWY